MINKPPPIPEPPKIRLVCGVCGDVTENGHEWVCRLLGTMLGASIAGVCFALGLIIIGLILRQ